MNLGRDVYNAVKDDSILKPSAAMWLYDESAQEWRFLIASDQARRFGPKAAYARVYSILKRAGLLNRLPLRRIAITTPDDPILSSIATCISVEPGALGTFYNCVFNGVAIAGMVAYQLGRQQQAAATVAPDAVAVHASQG